MKLLLSTRDYPAELAGLTTWTNEIARRLAPRCADFALLHIGSGAVRLADAGTLLETIRLPSHARGLAGAAARALGGRRASRFDVVLGADWLSAALGLAWRGHSRVRRVFTLLHGPELYAHGPRAHWPLRAVYERSCALTLARFDAVFLASGQARRLLERRGWPVRRRALVGEGCDTEQFKPTERAALARELGLHEERRVLLSVGRLIPERQLDKVLFAVSALGVRYPELRYVIAGDGPERGRLEALAERLRIGHRVRFLGEVELDTLPAVYGLADVVVQLSAGPASFVPGAGAVLLQALACGIPVVASASAATLDLLDLHTGRVVPDDDSVALADALSELIDRPALGRQLGARGRARVLASATWDEVAERLLSALADPSTLPAAGNVVLPGARDTGRVRRENAGAILVER
jgi:glycosyltransferase involved in cell wall biosynthesis